MPTQKLHISISAAFQVGDLGAHVEFEDGSSLPLLLRKGQFQGTIELSPQQVRAKRLKISDEPFWEGQQAMAHEVLDEPGDPRGISVDLSILFGEGVEIPEDGTLSLQLQWLAHCDGDPIDKQEQENTRFVAYEHTQCSRLIGLDEEGNALAINGLVADFNDATLLPVGQKELLFGQIIALAGDFYAHLDEQASKEFAWAWPSLKGLTSWISGDYRALTLVADSPKAVKTLLDVVARDKDKLMSAVKEFGTLASDSVAIDYPMRRYLALASQNHCHFASQPLGYGDHGNEALTLYRAYHRRALKEAGEAGGSSDWAGLHRALVVDAFACHFLTDLFASGHIRTPRRLLSERFGLITGGLVKALSMHGEDNRLGLWVTTRLATTPRVVWRAYGDGALNKPEARIHATQIQEAVRLSTAEVFARFCGGTISADARAEDRIPVPLRPGELPAPDDRLPSGEEPGQGYARIESNHYPMYVQLSDGCLAQRSVSLWTNQYRRLEQNASREFLALPA